MRGQRPYFGCAAMLAASALLLASRGAGNSIAAPAEQGPSGPPPAGLGTATATAVPPMPRPRPASLGAPGPVSTDPTLAPSLPGLPASTATTPSPPPSGASAGLPGGTVPPGGPPTPVALSVAAALPPIATDSTPSPLPTAGPSIRAPANLRVLSSGPQPGIYTLTWDPSGNETVTEYRVRQVGA